MDAYMYQAALYCPNCIVEACIVDGVLSPAARDMDVDVALNQARQAMGWDDESDYDSDDFPKGPYCDGGGEADWPQHCDACGVFLENPLTGDDVQYIRDAIAEHHASGRGNNDVLREWAKFYDIPFDVETSGE